MTQVEIVAAAHKSAELCAITVAVGVSLKSAPAGVVTVVTAIDPSIDIKATVEIRGIEPASGAVDINTSWSQIAPGMGVVAHQSKCQMIGEPVIDSQVDPTGREFIASGIKIRIDKHKVAKARGRANGSL